MVEAIADAGIGGIGDIGGGIDGVINGTGGAHTWNKGVARNRVAEKMKLKNVTAPSFRELRELVQETLGEDMHHWIKERDRVSTYERKYRITDNGLVIDGGDFDGESFHDTFIRRPRELGPALGFTPDEHELKRLEILEKALLSGKTHLVTATSINREFRYIEKWEVGSDGKVVVKGKDIGKVAGNDYSERNIASLVQLTTAQSQENALDAQGILFVVDNKTATTFFHQAEKIARNQIKAYEHDGRVQQIQSQLRYARQTLHAESKASRQQFEKPESNHQMAERNHINRFIAPAKESNISNETKPKSNPLKDIFFTARLVSVWLYERKKRKELFAISKKEQSITQKTKERKMIVVVREAFTKVRTKMSEVVRRVEKRFGEIVRLPQKLVHVVERRVQKIKTKAQEFVREKIVPVIRRIQDVPVRLVAFVRRIKVSGERILNKRKIQELLIRKIEPLKRVFEKPIRIIKKQLEKSKVQVHTALLKVREFFHTTFRKKQEKKLSRVHVEKALLKQSRVEVMRQKLYARVEMVRQKTTQFIEKFKKPIRRFVFEFKRFLKPKSEKKVILKKPERVVRIPLLKFIREKFAKSTKRIEKQLVPIKKTMLRIARVVLRSIRGKTETRKIVLKEKQVGLQLLSFMQKIVYLTPLRFLVTLFERKQKAPLPVVELVSPKVEKEQESTQVWFLYIFWLWIHDKAYHFERPQGIAFGSPVSQSTKPQKVRSQSIVLYTYLQQKRIGDAIVGEGRLVL